MTEDANVDNRSLAQIVAEMSEEERESVLEGLDLDALLYDWAFWGRKSQQLPEGNWTEWLIMAARGTGKTRTGAETIKKWADECNSEPRRFGLVGRTAADTRDVQIQGPSGILSVYPPGDAPEYQSSRRRILFKCGCVALTFCVDQETQILTQEGWKFQDVLKDDDIVLTLNHDLGVSEWQPLEKIHRFDVVNEPMISVEMNFHSSLSTLNHRWPTIVKESRNRRWKDSLLDFTSKDSFVTGAPNIDLPTIPKYTDSFVALVGWYTAEGWISEYREKQTRQTCKDRDNFKSFVDERLKSFNWNYTDLASRMGSDWSRHRVRTLLRYGGTLESDRIILAKALGLSESAIENHFNDKEFRQYGIICQNTDGIHYPDIVARLTEEWGPPKETLKDVRTPSWRMKASGKKTSFFLTHEAVTQLSEVAPGKDKIVDLNFVLDLTRSQLQTFVDAFMDGDGHRRDNSSVTTQAVQGRLAAIELASILLGNAVRTDSRYAALYVKKHSVTIRPGERRSKKTILEAHELSTRPATKALAIPIHHSGDRRSITEYTGVTWCPQTANRTWLAKRNGTVYYTGNSAEEPDQLRGPQFNYLWGDETCSWPLAAGADNLTAIEQARIATRLGEHPRIIWTTTPKRVPFIKDFLDRIEKGDPSVFITKERTIDNRANLSEVYLATLEGLYKGTRLEQQELLGEYLDDIEGALWSEELLNLVRLNRNPMEFKNLPLRVVGVDPSVAAEPKDECGIVVCGSTNEHLLYKRQAYVLEDASLLAPPDEWARVVVRMARKWNAVVVAETNQGGDLVSSVIRTIDPTLKILTVHSKAGKALRAEPVIAAYDQQRVHHASYFPLLESQMASWIPGETRKSPDRVDALVFSLAALLVRPPKGLWSSASLYASASTQKLSGIKTYSKDVTARPMASPGRRGTGNFRVNKKNRRSGPGSSKGWHVK